MNRIITNNKENTTGTFYQTYAGSIQEERLFSSTRKVLDANLSTIDNLTMEVKCLLDKISLKIGSSE